MLIPRELSDLNTDFAVINCPGPSLSPVGSPWRLSGWNQRDRQETQGFRGFVGGKSRFFSSRNAAIRGFELRAGSGECWMSWERQGTRILEASWDGSLDPAGWGATARTCGN